MKTGRSLILMLAAILVCQGFAMAQLSPRATAGNLAGATVTGCFHTDFGMDCYSQVVNQYGVANRPGFFYFGVFERGSYGPDDTSQMIWYLQNRAGLYLMEFEIDLTGSLSVFDDVVHRIGRTTQGSGPETPATPLCLARGTSLMDWQDGCPGVVQIQKGARSGYIIWSTRTGLWDPQGRSENVGDMFVKTRLYFWEYPLCGTEIWYSLGTFQNVQWYDDTDLADQPVKQQTIREPIPSQPDACLPS